MRFLWMLEGIRTPFLDKCMQFITYFGQEIILIAVICALYWCVDKRFAYLLGFTYFTAGLCVQTLKITFRIPRPWILDPEFHAVESAVPGATGYSFPSGHTQGAVSLFFPLALKYRRSWVKLLCVLSFFLIGFSRMYLGCHTPKDVLTAMGISLVISWILWHFQDHLLSGSSSPALISGVLAALSLAVCAYALILHTDGTLEARYAADCLKASGAGLGFAAGYYVERSYMNFNTGGLSLPGQLLKLAAGLACALLLKSALSSFTGSSILAKALEYFILVLWVLVFYPFLFSKVQKGVHSKFSQN